MGLNALNPVQSLSLNTSTPGGGRGRGGEGGSAAYGSVGNKADSWGHMKDIKPKTCSRGSKPFVALEAKSSAKLSYSSVPLVPP